MMLLRYLSLLDPSHTHNNTLFYSSDPDDGKATSTQSKKATVMESIDLRTSSLCCSKECDPESSFYGNKVFLID